MLIPKASTRVTVITAVALLAAIVVLSQWRVVAWDFINSIVLPLSPSTTRVTLAPPSHSPSEHGSPRGDPLGVGDGETAAIEASKPEHIILYWTAPSTETGHLKQVFDLCPVKNCRATWDKSELPRASAVVISRDWASTPGDVASWLPPRRPGQPRIWRLNEPPVEGHMPFSLLKDLSGHVDWTSTYKYESDIFGGYGATAFLPVALQEERKRVYDELLANSGLSDKSVLWIVSNCGTKAQGKSCGGRKADVQSCRNHYYKELISHIDIIKHGKCGMVHGQAVGGCDRNDMACFDAYVKRFRFYLAFENSKCRWYITEKLWKVYKWQVKGIPIVPIVLGAPKGDYEKLAPPGSFIHVDDFDSPRALAEYLHYLLGNHSAFAAYFEWVKSYRTLGQYYTDCLMCNAMNNDSARKETTSSGKGRGGKYGDLHAWSTHGQCQPSKPWRWMKP
ncbi:hypothetical protein FOZ61_009650 [Perkinsus olseni]|uniref:Fucosyltransferase n=1 Tax=Perkinsus olseni TaxID=32597 RepID=A0A7J6M4W2_PEROL|nr:hypothetical protein FOZ61_009650 [Perkinsus olseni]